MPAALDPDAKALIARIAAAGRKPYHDMDVPQARKTYAEACRHTGLEPVQAVVRPITLLRGYKGPRLRLYWPADAPPGECLPGVVFAHGGGWVLGGLDTHETICRRLAKGVRAAVIAVDYGLSPETPFPGAVNDMVAALEAVAASPHSFGVDPSRLAVAGDSSGANLATVAALLARDQGGPHVCAQLLFYPITDLTAESPSYAGVGVGVDNLLTAPSMRWFRKLYLARPEDAGDWRASPLRAPSLKGAPQSLVVTCGRDPLCDEGRAYAARLEAEGVSVSSLHLADQVHGFLTSGGALRQAAPVLDMAAAWLRHRLVKSKPAYNGV
jgi:acetyl esterase